MKKGEIKGHSRLLRSRSVKKEQNFPQGIIIRWKKTFANTLTHVCISFWSPFFVAGW
jgi:hypothetical protein